MDNTDPFYTEFHRFGSQSHKMQGQGRGLVSAANVGYHKDYKSKKLAIK